MKLVNELIPKDKFDIETAHKLKGHSYEQVKPIVPELLKWIQDMNWPVAGPVSEFLEKISKHISTDIIEVLRGNDSTWKYWCLVVFGKTDKLDPVLLEEIKRIKNSASKIDIEEGVVEEAEKIINLNRA